MHTQRDDAATLAAAGVLAATVAQAAHETLGHAGACLVAGGQVLRLTSIYFRCSQGSLLTDVAGPLAGFAIGAGAFALLAALPRLGQAARLFLLTLGAIALLWSFGQLAYDARQRLDDWRLAVEAPGWRLPLIAIGVGGYLATLFLARRLAGGLAAATPGLTLRRLLIPVAAGVVSAMIAGACWPKDPFRSALEGLLTLGVLPLGYLWTASSTSRRPAPSPPIGRSWTWIGAAGAIFAAFALIQGRGLGPLS
jgi:hypothetical protein